MAKRLPLIVLLASHLFISGVLSTSKLTIENKCNDTIWPVLFSYTSRVSTTGFALRRGEARDIQAPSSWHGLVSARTLCSTKVSTGNLSCATGDCKSGKLECPGEYSWSPTTYAIFRIDYEGTNTHTITVEYGYNLPLLVVPSQSSQTCIASGCSVDLNNTCPPDLKIFVEGEPIACQSACARFGTREICCERYFKSRQNCKPTPYAKNFESACPFAYVYSYGDNNSTFTCSNSTDYVVTFCPSSIPRNSMAPLGGAKDNSQWKLNLILGSSAALVAIVIIVVVVVLVRAKDARRKSDSNNENIDAAVMLKRYSYENVKKMTNSFDQVIGKGGFGTVYKGKLPDSSGRDIAIKILDDTKGNGEDFINELASMSRASHVNIVSLFGFCHEGTKRAIIYEFMPNGSLDKFLSENMSTKMDWRTLYNIAAGVARGLEYLHNSCVSKIVHFVRKPQNILMDEDMCPKISDFGLAKLCKNKESIISMLDARGTIGYIAPEVFSKSYGGVSHKSDVYSYGMVVLEMIGAKNKERAEASRLDKCTMYFPDWIYEDLERKEAMRLSGDQVTDEEEEEIATKMTLVGLWCIQTIPSDRPPMRKVVEMLAGSLDALVVPPKPLLTLPAVMASETTEESQETSSLLTPSQLE